MCDNIYMMNNYYSKYIKYKSKYLELKGYKIDSISYDAYQTKYIKEKGQTGGVNKPCDDALKISDITIATILREYDCNYNQILKNFEKLLNKFNYNEFNEINKITIRNFLKKKITIRNLLDKQFPIDFLLKKHFPAPELKKAGVSVEDYIKENISIFTILQHFTLDELSNHYEFIKYKLLEQMIWRHFVLLRDLNALKINISMEDFLNKLKFSIKDLRDAGFTINDFKVKGFSEKDLKQAGFTAWDMQLSKYTVKQLIEL